MEKFIKKTIEVASKEIKQKSIQHADHYLRVRRSMFRKQHSGNDQFFLDRITEAFK